MNLKSRTAKGLAALLFTATVASLGLSGTSTATADPAGVLTKPTVSERESAYMNIKVPSVNISAPVLAVGASNGSMDVPANTGTLGWWDKTAQFGDVIGTMVLAGHVSNNSDRPGALYPLRRAKVGEKITISRNGTTLTYVIKSMDYNPRSAPLPSTLFANTGRNRLALVTCARKETYSDGSFHYRDNLIVIAEQVNVDFS